MPVVRMVERLELAARYSLGKTIQGGVHSSVSGTRMALPTEEGQVADPHKLTYLGLPLKR